MAWYLTRAVLHSCCRAIRHIDLSSGVSNHLDGDTLAAALTSGIHRVLAEQELLNRINVFPVADSDTEVNAQC